MSINRQHTVHNKHDVLVYAIYKYMRFSRRCTIMSSGMSRGLVLFSYNKAAEKRTACIFMD